MNVRRAAAALALAGVALLAACAPGARPRTVDLSAAPAGEAFVARAGETIDLVVRYEYDEFGLRPGDLEVLEIVPPELERERRVVSGAFALREAGLPAGWSAREVRVTRVLEPLGEESRLGLDEENESGDLYRLEARYRLSVPADAEPGTYTLRLVLRARDGTEVVRTPRVEVVVEVVPPSEAP